MPTPAACCRSAIASEHRLGPQYHNGFSAVNQKTTERQANELVSSASVARNASPAAGPAAPQRVAYCVFGQARGFHRPAFLTSLMDGLFGVGMSSVDVFAVIDADCQPHLCTGNVQGRMDHWLQRVRPVRAIITGNDSRLARTEGIGLEAAPPVDRSLCGENWKSMWTHHASTFWHQQMRAQQCFRMVQEEERRRRRRYDWVIRARPEFEARCVCPMQAPPSPSRIYSYDSCRATQKAPVLCDAFFAVPRRWADVVFNAVDGWGDCHAYRARFPCHAPEGLMPECLLSTWLVDHGVPRSAFGEGTELQALGVVRGLQVRHADSVKSHKTLCKSGLTTQRCEPKWLLAASRLKKSRDGRVPARRAAAAHGLARDAPVRVPT